MRDPEITESDLFAAPPPINGNVNAETPLAHPCEVCGDPNAPFGYGAFGKEGRRGSFYCRLHRPDREPSRAGDAS